MKRKTIVVEIDEQGNSSLDLQGFEGKGCVEAAKDFRGDDSVKVERNKREFYVQSQAVKQQKA